MAPRRKCPVCGSKQWHKDSSSGLVACSEGHVIQNYRNESGEADDLGNYAMRKRTLKSGRQKKGRPSRADPKLYHGERGRFHYYQCLQLLLRKQIAALITLWDLPPEFEIVCRDTWTLHLNLLPRPPPAEPYHYLREQGSKGSDASGVNHSSENDEESKSDDDLDFDEHQSSSSSSEEEDPELVELLRENSEVSSLDEDRGCTSQHATEQGVPQRYRFIDKYDRPVNCIAVLIVACWTVRLPIMYKDFIDIIESYRLPYLEFLRFLPADMTCHLTKHAIRALSPRFPPNVLYLHRLTSRLAKLMYANYGVFTPELNASPVLWRVVYQCLGSTPMMYKLAKRLGHILSLPLTLHHTLAPSLQRAAPGDPGGHLYDDIPPELALVATAIIVLKLVYGLDGKMRLPRVAADPASALPDLQAYMSAISKMDETDNRCDERRFSLSAPMPTADMEDAALDEFFDFCERALVGPKNGDADQILDKYFPLLVGNVDDRLDVPTAYAVIQGLAPTRINTGLGETDDFQPAESYTMCHSRDVLGNLPEEQALIITRSAKWVGVSNDYLCGVVERFERRLQRWYYKERKRERDEEEAGKEEMMA